MEEYFCKTRILSGEGALKSLETMGIRRLLLVTDPFFAQNGMAQTIGAMTGAEIWEVFDKVAPDPTVELVAEGTAQLLALKPDTVIALGGGSAMDCAKAMVWFSKLPVELIAIPTTSGSGSEVTDFAILTYGQVKHPLVDASLRPGVAILDGTLPETMPKSLVADGGFDVLSHALEAWVGKRGSAFSAALAQYAFCRAYAQLPASYAGDKSVRSSIHQAATMAGMAFSQAGLGVCHAMAHSLGGAFHLPHGRLNAILLPVVVGKNGVPAAYAELARAAGLGGAADAVAVRNLQNGLISLRKTLQLPATLAQAGVSAAKVRAMTPALVEATLAHPCCQTNPVNVTAELVRSILEAVTGHG